MAETGYSPPKMNNKAFRTLAIFVAFGALLTGIAFLYPLIFTTILNFIWIMILIAVAVFLVLGVLVIVGMKDEVGSFLDVLLEGSLSILDAINIIKRIYQRFIQLLKDFIYFITPILAIWVAGIIYIALLILYKSIGAENDVTLLTTVLTVAMVVAVGVLNRPTQVPEIETWIDSVKKRFKFYFSDAFEIVVFIFFLTMDSTRLFFLPDNLNVPLEAHLGQYNLMLRGTDYSNQLMVTIYLVTFSIFIEILRNIIKMFSIAVSYYKEFPREESRIINIKEAIRLSFSDSKDDLLKFITFTTFLILVFLLFPRLKLYAMLITTVTGLILDVLMPSRLHLKKSNDLISRLLNKTFKL